MAQTTMTALPEREGNSLLTPTTCASCESLLLFRIIFDEYQRKLAGQSAADRARVQQILDRPDYSGTLIGDLEDTVERVAKTRAAASV